MRRKRVFLKAYICNNLGDDLFVKSIALRYPDVDFYLQCSNKYTKAFAEHKNIKIMSKPLLWMDRAAKKISGRPMIRHLMMKKADAFVHIGGSVFIEPEGFQKAQWSRPNKNFFTIGANFGPYRSEGFVDYTRERIQKMRDICFRDKYSYAFFKELGNVRVAPDVLFGYPMYPQSDNGNGVGISVIRLDLRPNLQEKAAMYYDAIAKVVSQCQERGIPVKLFGFCAKEGDDKAIANVLERLQDKKVDTYLYDGDIEAFLAAFHSCDHIIATRFHAMVIGWRLGKRVFPIIYSNKQTHVIEDVGFKGKMWDLTAAQDYDGEALLRDCMGNDQLEDIDCLARESLRQFLKLDEFIECT